MLSVSAHQTFYFAQTDYSVKVMNLLIQADNRKATKQLLLYMQYDPTTLLHSYADKCPAYSSETAVYI